MSSHDPGLGHRVSIDHVSKVLNLGPEVNGTTRMVLIVLAEAAHQDTDECWPGTATIRKRAGLKQDRYVVKAVAALVEMGLVFVDPNGCPDHRIRADRRPNLYHMVGTMALLDGGARRAGSSVDGGARRASTGVRVAPNAPHIEPEVEPEKDSRARVSAEESFEMFWAVWPQRGGRKLHKAEALTLWTRLSLDCQRSAYRGAKHYAAACVNGTQGAMDPDRWLRKKEWLDWQEPVAPSVSHVRRPTRGDGAMAAADELVAQWRNE